MPQYGLCLQVNHTGKAADSIHVSDIRDGIDLLGGAYGFRKPGAIYVPTPANGGMSILVYSGDVAVSFETGGIRKFIQGGYLTAQFIIGSTLGPAIFPEVQDEGVPVDPATQILNFTGAGVTAVQTAPGEVRVDIPGAGAGNHALLLPASLVWTASAHTGNVGTVAGFDGAGATRYYVIGTDLQAWDADLDALAALAGTGVAVRTGPGTWTTRTIQGTAGRILVTNGDGIAGDPTIDIGPNVGDVHGPGVPVTDNALVRWDTASGTLIQNSNVILSDAGDMTFTGGTTLSVDNVAEATAGNGVVVNTIRNYGKAAADPAGPPAPADGDTYYNTALRMNMVYDGSRSKWLSVESAEFHFGRDGVTAVGQYYRAADGRVMGPTGGAAFLGWYAIRSGTVVSLGYTRSDSDAATFDVVRGGVSIATVASAAIAGRDITLNADFTFGDVLAVLNQAGGGNNPTSDVIGWIRVKWRV